jgi:hypothetical protein
VDRVNIALVQVVLHGTQPQGVVLGLEPPQLRLELLHSLLQAPHLPEETEVGAAYVPEKRLRHTAILHAGTDKGSEFGPDRRALAGASAPAFVKLGHDTGRDFMVPPLLHLRQRQVSKRQRFGP